MTVSGETLLASKSAWSNGRVSVGGDIARGIGAGMRWGEHGSRSGRTSASAGLVLPWAMSRRHRHDSLTTG